MDVKGRNELAIVELKTQCKDLVRNTDQLKNQVKAQHRHNKLLNVALTKAKD